MNAFKIAAYLIVAIIAQAACNPVEVYYKNGGGGGGGDYKEYAKGSGYEGGLSSSSSSGSGYDSGYGGGHCKKHSVLYVNKVEPIVVDRKGSQVSVDDEQSLVVKSAPVIIHRSRPVEVRPVIVKHRPAPLYVRPKIVKVFRPIHKKYFVEKYSKQEGGHEGEVISRHVDTIGGDKWDNESGGKQYYGGDQENNGNWEKHGNGYGGNDNHDDDDESKWSNIKEHGAEWEDGKEWQKIWTGGDKYNSKNGDDGGKWESDGGKWDSESGKWINE